MLPETGNDGTAVDGERSLLEAIVDSTGDAVVSIDRDGRITSWNPAAERLYGYGERQAVGSHMAMLFPQAGELEAKLERVFRGEQVAESQTSRLRKDGTTVVVGETLSPIRGGDHVIGAAAIARDIGARLEIERALAATRRELEKKNRSLQRSNAELEQFAYVASHDLSEPLRAVAGMVSLLARRYVGRLDDDADEFIAFAVEGCERMRSMIEDLLEFSRAGRTELHMQPVDLQALTARVVDSLRTQVDEADADVQIGELPTVQADPTQIGRVVQNLLANAIKFHRPEQRPVVRISAARSAENWRVEVEDNGIGIEEQYRPRVFGMFERLHTRDTYPGTGMGLAIAERIVDRHGGAIGVEVSPSGGSTFWFTLPDGPSEELQA